jgi:membrane protein required for colicin V production
MLQPDMLADVLALLGVFLALLIPASFVSFRLTELVRGTHAGPLDRSLGFVFGIARGLLVVGLGYIVYSALAPAAKQPEWVREARLLPVVKGTADVILSLGSKKKADEEETAADVEETKDKDAGNGATTAKKPAGKSDTDNKEGGGDKGKAYDAGDRRALDQLVRSTSKE